jgi:NitT/TauT family transport system permease protein
LRKILAKWFLPLAGVVLLLVIWQAYISSQSNHFLKPPAEEVLRELLANRDEYWQAGLATMEEAGLGFLAGNVIALALAVWMAYSENVARLIYPYAIGLKATPVVALAPLLVTLVGLGFFSKVVCAAIVCFFPIIVQVPDSIRRIPIELLDLFKSFGASEIEIFRRLRVNLAAPSIFAALKTSSTLSVVGAIVGEFMSPNRGVGRALVEATANGKGAALVATTIVATAIGILFFVLVHALENLLITWKSDVI